MIKNYSLSKIIGSAMLMLNGAAALAQTGWTVYDNSNSSLTSTTYKALEIDAAGNIWTGGWYSGLYKYNGSSWTRYYTFNSSILDDDINDVVIDNSGKIWAANYKGVSVFNGSTFTNYDTSNAGFEGYTCSRLGKDNNGVIWLATRTGSFGYKDLTTYNGTSWNNLTGYPSQLNGAEYGDFAFTSSNEAWIASDPGITKYNGTFSFYPKAVTGLWSSESVAIDASGNIWAGGFDGLLKYNGTSWTFYDATTALGLSSNTFFYDIFPDGNYLWIGSSRGLLKVDRFTGAVAANYKSTNSPLQDNCVIDIEKDASGNLWLATTIGIVKMNPSAVGMEENSYNASINVYPNPSSGSVNVFIDGNSNLASEKLSFHIVNSLGQEVCVKQVSMQLNELSLDEMPDGIYFIQLADADGNCISNKKVIIQH